jgi:hypothetical protein
LILSYNQILFLSREKATSSEDIGKTLSGLLESGEACPSHGDST